MYTLPPQYHVAFRYVAVLLIALPLDIIYSYVHQLLHVRYNAKSLTGLLIVHLLVQTGLLVVLMMTFGLWGASASVPISLGVALGWGMILERRQMTQSKTSDA
ncbi:MAG: hypothetical protein EOO38_08250 [Cytophagaceae bacterium]|nr:MAG: hypothetical protein EOO38_08250 [Cytophagaceae bacterium]